VLARILTPAEVRALALRFGEDLDLKEIAARLWAGLAPASGASHASRTIDGALKKLHRRRFELLRWLGAA
jgi:hypothetical protein